MGTAGPLVRRTLITYVYDLLLLLLLLLSLLYIFTGVGISTGVCDHCGRRSLTIHDMCMREISSTHRNRMSSSKRSRAYTTRTRMYTRMQTFTYLFSRERLISRYFFIYFFFYIHFSPPHRSFSWYPDKRQGVVQVRHKRFQMTKRFQELIIHTRTGSSGETVAVHWSSL